MVMKRSKSRGRYVKKSIPKRLSGNLTFALSSANNKAQDQASIQAILTNHFPGAVLSWNNVAYQVVSPRSLFGYINLAFQNSLQLTITGIKIVARSDPSTTLCACYRQDVNDHLRVVSGIGSLRAVFNFKNKVMGQYFVMIGETDCTFKVVFYYEPNQLTSVL